MGVVGTPSGSGRALRLDPFALPMRYAARDHAADDEIRQIELDRDRVMLRRAVRGIRMNVGVPVAEFRGVTMRMLPPDGEEPAAVAVTLDHRDNGLSVPLNLSIESAMTAADHVRSIALFSEKNPRPLIAKFQLGAAAGRAEVATRVRLNGSQRLLAVAQLSDGSWWSGGAEVVVTESACLDDS